MPHEEPSARGILRAGQNAVKSVKTTTSAAAVTNCSRIKEDLRVYNFLNGVYKLNV